MNLKIKEVISNILQSLLVKQYTMTFPSTVGIAYFKVYKCAGLVTIHAVNVNKASTGSNTIGVLPAGWRPKETATLMLIPPVSSISTGGTELSLRLSVQTNGRVELYNYRSAAVSGNTNASGTLTFPVGGGWYCLTAFSRLSAIVRGWRYELESKGNTGQSGTGVNRSAKAPDYVQTVISGQEKRLGLDSTVHRGFVPLIRVNLEDVYISRMERRTSSARRTFDSLPEPECLNAVHHISKERRQGSRIWPKQRLLFAQRLDIFRSLWFSELTTPRLGVVA